MERTIRADLYESASAKRVTSGEYCEPLYDRGGRTKDSRAAWKEPVYDGRRRKTDAVGTAWKEPIYDSRSRTAGNVGAVWKEPIYDGRNRAVGKESVYGRKGRETGARGAVRRESEYVQKGRKPAAGADRAVLRAPVHGKRNRSCGNSTRKSGRHNTKKTQLKVLRGLFLYFFLTGIIATVWMIFSFFTGGEDKIHAADAMKNDSEQTAAETGFLDGDAYDENSSRSVLEVTPEIRQQCQELYAGRETLLQLVNKDCELPASYQPVLRSICKGRLEAADILYEDLCAMLQAGGEAGYEYWIASAHRDRAYQQGLVDEDVEKYMAKGYTYEAALQKTYEYTMPAGQSEHETGLALDILCSANTIMDESQASEPGNRWLVEHCHEYGFILRYPADKEDVTGIKYEPWHFRYVGREAAAYLREKGWTLEEFYEAMGSGSV